MRVNITVFMARYIHLPVVEVDVEFAQDVKFQVVVV
jgi:hypothetical protein